MRALSAHGSRPRGLEWFALALSAICWLAAAAWSPAATAHGTTPHVNDATTIEWEQDGVEDGSVNHNHLHPHDVRDRNDEANHHSHDGYAAWHNRAFIPEMIAPDKFWHGFIEENVNQPRYQFTPTDAAKGITQLNAAAQGIVNAAFDLWEKRAHEEGAKEPHTRTGIDFDNNQESFEFSILMIDDLYKCRGAAGEWIFLPDQLKAEPADPANPCPVAAGQAWSKLDAATRPGEPKLLATMTLVFDANSVPWEYIALDSLVAPGADSVDFASDALHETGHVVGLAHTPGDHANHIMRANVSVHLQGGNFLRTIEKDSAVGAAELYTIREPIAVPEPSSLLLMLAGAILLAGRARSRPCAAA